ncbi:TrmH family RNA methyltransferase [Aquimarina muelleri]|uniref:TrmH family RNA methyltransferase n=1 Tax=Aquimarina muelleri TaxID=279356 RepID=UPI003F686EBD
MVSKNQKKLIKSLYQKKYRKQYGLFVAEGKKVINELLEEGVKLYSLFTIEDIFDVDQASKYIVTEEELKQISFLTTPQIVLAVFYIPYNGGIEERGLILVLDDIRDPGNLGTIIRLCDWFGIKDLVCSMQTVDCYNPKVIQATMGSITRVNINYVDLKSFLTTKAKEFKVYGTFMEGKSIYKEQLSENAILIMGNEANGISESIQNFVQDKVTIPQFGINKKTESLNVATATAIVLSEFKRS